MFENRKHFSVHRSVAGASHGAILTGCSRGGTKLDPAWLSPSTEPQHSSTANKQKMKFSGDSEILSLTIDNLMNTWSNGEHMLIDGNSQKLMLGEEEDSNSKGAMDDLDLLLTSTQSPNAQEPNNNLAELKPLPPFTGYTGHLSINGISGHHYHTIASAPSPPRVETNNNSSDTTNQNTIYYTADQVVSSSTMDCTLDNIKTEVNVEDYNSLLAPDIEDIAAIIGIGSAMADTTVPGSNNNNGSGNQNSGSNGETSRDSWMDIDAWIDTACSQSSGANGKAIISAESLQEFVATSQYSVSASSPAAAAAVIAYQQQHIKREPTSSSYMPLLQGRLLNGPTKQEISYSGLVSECPSPSSSTPYLAHSPPGHVVSTSDLGRYNPVHSSTRPSPELQVGYPHTTTPGKKSKSKSKSKSAAATSTVVYSEPNMGKEKPVHRCTICNRGFLNKSNIKVHLRTHTGEKPFKCDVCGKAFRQKAHLIKHAQIHRRIGRD